MMDINIERNDECDKKRRKSNQVHRVLDIFFGRMKKMKIWSFLSFGFLCIQSFTPDFNDSLTDNDDGLV